MKYAPLDLSIEVRECEDKEKPKYIAVVNGLLAFYADDETTARDKALKYMRQMEKAPTAV